MFDDEVKEDESIQFFELQIKTLFQHAWSEAEHDLGYKPTTILTSAQKKRLAFTAAQAWGADQIFDELFREIGSTGAEHQVMG
jgi:ppGpp synthetase/RelA/SpoT-type nucleotidyltranferase